MKKKKPNSFITMAAILEGFLLVAILIIVLGILKYLGAGGKAENSGTGNTVIATESDTSEEAAREASRKAAEEEAAREASRKAAEEEVSRKAAEEKAAREASRKAAEIPNISMDALNSNSVTASSTLDEHLYNTYYGPDNVIDGSLQTAWCEGVDGDGIGEYLMFSFDKMYRISGMYIYAGYHKIGDSDHYTRNGRPTMLRISGGGRSEVISLPDRKERFTVSFEKPFETDMIKIEILDAVSGSKYDDTLITEIIFY